MDPATPKSSVIWRALSWPETITTTAASPLLRLSTRRHSSSNFPDPIFAKRTSFLGGFGFLAFLFFQALLFGCDTTIGQGLRAAVFGHDVFRRGAPFAIAVPHDVLASFGSRWDPGTDWALDDQPYA